MATMTKRKGFKFRIYPTSEQIKFIEETSRCYNYIYNRCLRIQTDRYEAKKARTALGDMQKRNEDKHLSRFDMNAFIKEWRSDPKTIFLANAPFGVLTASVSALDGAFKRFFKGIAEHPTFHKNKRRYSYTQQARSVYYDAEKRLIKVPRMGWVKCRGWDVIRGNIKNISISGCKDRWFCSLQTEWEEDEPVHISTKAVGIDRGVVHTAVLSDGTYGLPTDEEQSYERRRKDIEQRISVLKRRNRNKQAPDKRTRVQPSNRWLHCQKRINKLEQKIKDMRENYLHRLSHVVTSDYSAIAIEDLKVQNMTASASGTVNKPGKNVRAKSGLNREIMSRAWGELERQLTYKSLDKGGVIVKVPAKNTSRMCSQCGHVDAANRQTQSRFVCTKCGFSLNADHNAAINIRNLAFAV